MAVVNVHARCHTNCVIGGPENTLLPPFSEKPLPGDGGGGVLPQQLGIHVRPTPRTRLEQVQQVPETRKFSEIKI